MQRYTDTSDDVIGGDVIGGDVIGDDVIGGDVIVIRTRL